MSFYRIVEAGPRSHITRYESTDFECILTVLDNWHEGLDASEPRTYYAEEWSEIYRCFLRMYR